MLAGNRFKLQGLVLFNSLLTGLEEWPSEVNFVFFGGKAMLVPLCLDRRIRNAKAARWVRSCYVGLLASWFLKMQSKMAKVNFYVPPPIDAAWFLLMTGKWGVWSRVKCRVLVLLEFGNWFYCSWMVAGKVRQGSCHFEVFGSKTEMHSKSEVWEKCECCLW